MPDCPRNDKKLLKSRALTFFFLDIHSMFHVQPKNTLPFRRALHRLSAALLLCLFLGFFASAQSMELSNLILDNQEGNITVRFGLDIDELSKIDEAIRNGSELGLVVRAKVSRNKLFLPDKAVVRAVFLSVLRRDELADEYVIEMPGDDVRRSKNLRMLLEDAWKNFSLVVGPWRKLEPGHDYVMSLEISVNRREVPDWLRYAVFFWNWDVVPEAGYRLNFKY
jgi:hypothetical protein